MAGISKRYVALLRGISNVSMDSFRKGLEELGFRDVESYGMSGNLLFNSARTDLASMERQITERFRTPAMLRSASNLKRVIAHDPFDSAIFFLVRAPSAARRSAFSRLEFESSRPVLSGKTVYYVHPARLNGKRTPLDFENALGVLGTARSARVVRQILARLSKAGSTE
jgi:uncharacterized protein (DUF1697 family)